MAYDPEARRQSNSAVVIGIIALILVGGGALAFLTMRPSTEPTTTIVNSPGRETVINNTVAVPVPVDNGPNTVVIQPAPGTTKTIERNTTTVRDRVISPAPASSAPVSRGGSESNTNVTVNVPPADSAPAPT
ncbi:hypothetical protein EON80_04225, partial [bacterium]